MALTRNAWLQDWDSAIKAIEDPSLSYPSYYTQPFHAYSEGNLCWEAALEVTLAAKSVHSSAMDPAGKQLDIEGDEKMRGSCSERMQVGNTSTPTRLQQQPLV